MDQLLILDLICLLGITDGAPKKKPRTDFTEWEEELNTIILDEIQEYSSANFCIDGEEKERKSRGKSTFLLGETRPVIPTTTATCQENSMHSSNKCCKRALLQCSRTLDAILFLHSGKKKFKIDLRSVILNQLAYLT